MNRFVRLRMFLGRKWKCGSCGGWYSRSVASEKRKGPFGPYKLCPGCVRYSDFRDKVYPLQCMELSAATNEECVSAVRRSQFEGEEETWLYSMLRARVNRKGWLSPGEVVDLMNAGLFTREHLIELQRNRA